MEDFPIPDGLEALKEELPVILKLIEKTAVWVNPEAFRRLPVWYPHTGRGHPLYDARWDARRTNTRRATGETSLKSEGNVAAIKALTAALGVVAPRPRHWTVCHIWGYDDPSYSAPSSIVQDPRYFTCLANMIWLPTPLKGFTDTVPEIKAMLRTCSFYLYGWACEHPSVAEQADQLRLRKTPPGYPVTWPSAEQPDIQPILTAPFSDRVAKSIERQKGIIKASLNNQIFKNYPRDAVAEVLKFWKINLEA